MAAAAGSNLVAKVLLTADGTQLVGEAAKGSVALDKLATSAERAGAAGVAMGAGMSVGAKAANENAAAAAVNSRAFEALGAETAALGTAEAAAGVNTGALERLLHAAGREAGVSREQFMGLSGVLGLIAGHPVAATLVAIAAGAVVGISAFDRYDATLRKVQATAIALGNQFQLTNDDIEKYENEIQSAADVSIKQSAAIEQAFLNANVSPDTWNATAAASLKLAEYWGTDVPAAAGKLAEALKDPKTAGEELLSTLNALTPPEKQLIDSLVNAGDQHAAVDEIVKRLNDHLKDMPSTVGLLAGLWDKLTTALGNADIKLGKWEHDALNFSPPDWMKEFFDVWVASSPAAPVAAPPPPSFTNIDHYNLGSTEAATAKNAIGQDPLEARKKEIESYIAQVKQQQAVEDLEGATAAQQKITTDQLTNAQRDLAQVNKELTDRTLNLNDAAKQHAEQVKEALKDGERMVASAAEEAIAQAGIAKATLDGAAALQAANDQAAIDKSTLPLRTAQRWAHGAAWQALKVDIDAVTDSMRKEQAAQHAAAAITEVRSGLGSISGSAFGGLDVEGLSAQFARAAKEAVEWRDTHIAALQKAGLYTKEMANDIQIEFRDKISKSFTDAVTSIRSAIGSLTDHAGSTGFALIFQEDMRAAHEWAQKMQLELASARQSILTNVTDPIEQKNALDEWQQYADDLSVIFNDKIAKIYQDDLNRRTDWAAGVQRSSIQMTKDTENWAKTSADAVKGFDDAAEKAFTSLDETGKQRVMDLVNFIIQELLKLAYQKFLAGSINQLGTDIFNILGSIFGLTGDVSVTGSPPPPLTTGAPVGYAAGTDSARGGRTEINEEGAELVTLPSGAKVMTHRATMDYLDHLYDRPTVLQLPSGAAAVQPPPMTVNIHNNANTKVTARQSTGSGGMPQLDVLIEPLKQAIADDIQKGKGPIPQSLETYYGVRRGTL